MKAEFVAELDGEDAMVAFGRRLSESARGGEVAMPL